MDYGFAVVFIFCFSFWVSVVNVLQQRSSDAYSSCFIGLFDSLAAKQLIVSAWRCFRSDISHHFLWTSFSGFQIMQWCVLCCFQVCHLLYSIWHWLQSSKISANQNCVLRNERNLQVSAVYFPVSSRNTGTCVIAFVSTYKTVLMSFAVVSF